MPVIKPHGLLNGDRLSQLSDEAKLYWPFLYAGSNGYGRFELNYSKILKSCFRNFYLKPSQDLISKLLTEYKERQLLFIYEAKGTLWAAWDSAARQNYYSHEDERSPVPPEPAFSEWKGAYRSRKAASQESGPEDDLASQFRKDAVKDLPSIESQASLVSSVEVSKDAIEDRGVSQTDTSISISKTSISKTSETSTCAGAKAILRPEPPAPSELGIEGWDELIEQAGHAGMAMDADPSSDLCQKYWRHLNFEERRQRIQGIRERKLAGQYDDRQYVPTLENYVRVKWRESIRGRPQKLDRGAALIARYADDKEIPKAKGPSTTHGHSPPKSGIGMSCVAGRKTG